MRLFERDSILCTNEQCILTVVFSSGKWTSKVKEIKCTINNEIKLIAFSTQREENKDREIDWAENKVCRRTEKEREKEWKEK